VRMLLPYKKLPKRFLIELVYRVTMLINYLPKKGGIPRIISPRELVTGKKLRVPDHHIGQYVQGIQEVLSIQEKKDLWTHCTLVWADNGEGHIVFKLSTKQLVSVNRVTVITPTADRAKFVNDMADGENQPEGLEFAEINCKVTLEDFLDDINDDDDVSNASDDDYVHNKENQKEFNEETSLNTMRGWQLKRIMLMLSTMTWNNWCRILMTDPVSKILDSGPVSMAGPSLSVTKLRSV
jgi:hypothetical protein